MPKSTHISDGLHIVKLMARKNNCTTTIPMDVCKEMRFRPGVDRVLMAAMANCLVICKADSFDPDVALQEFSRKLDELGEVIVSTSAKTSTKARA